MADLDFEFVDSWVIVRFNTYNLSEASQIDRIVQAVVAKIELLPPPPKIILNFKKVEFVSSQVIGVLLDIQSKIEKRGGQLTLVRLNPKIYEAMKITRLDKRFRICESSNEAIGRTKRGE